MRNTDDFDAFYKATRARLLLQTFALTGDLPAARGAVRDAYIVAWHHWRKVSRRRDPEAWLRPQAWAQAQRRHSARLWHRDRSLDDDIRATLDALGKLSLPQRRVLLLNHLTPAELADIGREVGLTREATERTLQAAVAQYAVHRDCASTEVAVHVNALASVTEAVQLPRSSIIRRAGSARRRTFTAIAAAAAVATLVGSGVLVTDHGGVAPNLAQEKLTPSPSPEPEPEPARLDDTGLLTSAEATRLEPGRTWRAGEITPNTGGSGLYSPCQAARFADPRGTQTLVRSFDSDAARKQVPVRAVQAVEMSHNEARAERAYTAVVGWYAGCTDPRTRLVAAYDLSGVGDQATVFLLRSWGRKPRTVTVGVARTDQITTTTVRVASGADHAQLRPVAKVLGAAVNRLCNGPGGGTCAVPAKLAEIPPPPVGSPPGLLDVVDLPQAGTSLGAWIGTDAVKASDNLAAVSCDHSDFSRKPVSRGRTRSYLIVTGKLPKRFGITETIGTLPSPKAAHGFVEAVRKRLGSCEDRDLASTVVRLGDGSADAMEMTAWHVVTKVTDEDSLDYLMAIIRHGSTVGQVGFITAKGASYDKATFLALARRAADRLATAPPAEKN